MFAHIRVYSDDGTNAVSANYGSGAAFNVMQKHMEKAWNSLHFKDIKAIETARAIISILIAKSDKLQKLIEKRQLT